MRQSTYLFFGACTLVAALTVYAVLTDAPFYEAGKPGLRDHQQESVDTDGLVKNTPQIRPKNYAPAAFNDNKPDLTAIPWHDPAEMRALIPPAVNHGTDWHIYKTEWSRADELGYIAFVSALGRAACFSIDECLRDPANPYRDLENDFIWLGDCADMAYVLRGYYAWKNGLPFSYQNALVSARGKKEDLRYSTQGNIVVGRRSALTSARGKPTNAQKFLDRMRGEVSTAMFRTHPVSGARGTFNDFYSVGIDRAYLTPGSVAYDIYGHVGIVYQIEEDGRILIVASHPDQTVARSWYGPNFQRSAPDKGSGLKAWRPIKLVDAWQTPQGTWVGGRIVAAPNEALEGFSMLQYEGTNADTGGDWRTADFIWKDRSINYYDYVRRKLALPGMPIHPLTEFQEALQSLCSDTHARRIAVTLATRHKIHLKKARDRLPSNIYGTNGLWEDYSTPSRDARLKTGFVDLLRLAKEFVTLEAAQDKELFYQGDNLARDLLTIYQQQTAACAVSYERMDGTFVVMDLSHVNQRLFDLSFDPYHCPERRWGARGAELSTCIESPKKRAWYEAQQYLRNQIDRTYDQYTGFKLSELKSPQEAAPAQGGLGEATPPDADVKGYLLAEAKKGRGLLASNVTRQEGQKGQSGQGGQE